MNLQTFKTLIVTTSALGISFKVLRQVPLLGRFIPDIGNFLVKAPYGIFNAFSAVFSSMRYIYSSSFFRPALNARYLIRPRYILLYVLAGHLPFCNVFLFNGVIQTKTRTHIVGLSILFFFYTLLLDYILSKLLNYLLPIPATPITNRPTALLTFCYFLNNYSFQSMNYFSFTILRVLLYGLLNIIDVNAGGRVVTTLYYLVAMYTHLFCAGYSIDHNYSKIPKLVFYT